MNSSRDYKKIKSQKDRLALRNRNLHREITNSDYEFEKGKKMEDGKGRCFRKILFAKPKNFKNIASMRDSSASYYERYRIDEKYWESPTFAYRTPTSHGGVNLLICAGLTFIFLMGFDKAEWYYVLIWVVTLLLSILHISYYITIPKNKEFILDRLQGAITFPGYFWEPNNTMTFKKLKFFIPSGGTNVIAAPGINILSPKIFRSFFFFSICGSSYDDMTILTWYMDKNRPLPPFDHLKPYREQDFERRKAEGFPPPLYPAFFSIREDTPEQQAERDKYWVEEITTDENSNTSCNIYRGNEIFDFDTRTWFNLSALEKRDGEYYHNEDKINLN